MNAKTAFVDTNVWVYLYSDTYPAKKRAAFHAINDYECFISTQVLNEFCNICIKKLGKTKLDIKNEIRLISASTNCSLIDEETINKALDIHERYGYSYYDSLLVSSALQCNCDFYLVKICVMNNKLKS